MSKKWYVSVNDRWLSGRKDQTQHHIIPVSRRGRDDKKNVVMIPRKFHDLYHRIFENLTPVEIIFFLVERFWNGQWEYVEQALEKKYEPR